MCIVSMVGDDWTKRFPSTFPNFGPNNVSRQEFDKLKQEVESIKKLLIAAKGYDESTGQKDCEMEEKIKLITDIAKVVGFDLSEAFKK